MPIINACKIQSQPLKTWLLNACTKKTKSSSEGTASGDFHLWGEAEGVRIFFFPSELEPFRNITHIHA